MIKNIVFDLGGVLIHLTMEECIRRFLQLGVYDIEDQLNHYQPQGLFGGLERGDYSPYEFVKLLQERYQIEVSYEDVLYCLRGFIEEVQPYKFDFIQQELEGRYELYLLSNNNPFTYNHCNSREFLPSQRRLESYFRRCYCSYILRLCKPDPRIFLEMIKDSGMQKEESLFVDDSPANIEVAQQLGFKTLLTKNGEDWRKRLKTALHNG